MSRYLSMALEGELFGYPKRWFAIGGVFLLGLIMWTSMASSVKDQGEVWQTTYAQYIAVKELADQVTTRSGQAQSKKPINLISFIEQQAKKSGIHRDITRLRPQTGLSQKPTVLLQAKQMPFEKLIGFLKEIAVNGIMVRKANVRRTSQAGIVEVELTFAG